MNELVPGTFDHARVRREASPIVALKSDPRFSFTLYVPPELHADTPILVAIHGNMRNLIATRDAFADLARWKNVVVVAPLFPHGVLGDDNKDGFKFIKEGSIRYDDLLLEIVEQAKQHCGLRARKFALFGFAGGGQFAHRFALLHPHRLWAASIAAPGSVTLLDDSKKWWVGIKDVNEVLGMEIDREALARLPIHLVVGDADVDPGTNDQSHVWMPGGRDAGETAMERLRSLEASLRAQGVEVEFSVMPRKGHVLADLVPASKDFFARHLPQSVAT
ncbi:hypothetical protein SAMN05428969_1996 [Devosia sp. YR412]|uniref:hypothetical protein n=1 Tax=Devosia sp. YR412 TaxID=1881030 RepID=UPI0008C58F1A|nr:hypothetical protein [Devosia sp. YR412]SEQ10612.1 hypothetical protein SAMN05428969_1996 [Devosia sp. YR412]